MSQPSYSERRFMFRTEDIIDEITQWIDSNLHKPLKIEDVVAQQDIPGGIFMRINNLVKSIPHSE
ncbi:MULTISPECIES: hypothetical protein [Citrobacter]|nr:MULTISPECIES: hypothetical protein [Citrobacter]MDK6743252.1 hypothetical protein [Citrobacter sp. UMB8248A]MDK8124892.1 hypothetical protein [Citrobacter koseri]MDT7491536.1 hypothetical protein [Citrobacter koseri]MDT7501111.1 hypothetical protein [Citrobacter koseri]MDU3231493.1 hypothetical protein [Citrobacter koseri]